MEAYVALDYIHEILGCQSNTNVEEFSMLMTMSSHMNAMNALDSMSAVVTLPIKLIQNSKQIVPIAIQTTIIDVDQIIYLSKSKIKP
jgi:hypothetical protein